ncbi:MAG: DeoR family transcriptional regulator [Desulfotignum sp.]|jgi:DeoR family glycerol-3-phosphate regulon repressor|nr:DeoR family transcriptional regulator [Desulfotignum sp.]
MAINNKNVHMNPMQNMPVLHKKTLSLSDRQARMVEMIRQENVIHVEPLARHFRVSTQTIRRDLRVLCNQGFALRIHGGAKCPEPAGNMACGWRPIPNETVKQAIARKVARQIPNGASVALGAGTTPEIVAQALLGHDHLKIFTCSLNIAMLASANPGFEVTIAGGRLRNADKNVLGSGMENLFRAYKVDVGICGAAGVDDDGTLLDFSEEDVRLRQIIRENCRCVYLVLDQTKFGRAAHVRGGRIVEAAKIFCDCMPPPPICALIDRSNALLTVCAAEG